MRASLNESTPQQVRVGIALSGGGFRASAFHLGVLKRLEELGVLARLDALSTVSGGSITGALYALRCAERGDASPGAYPVDLLVEEVVPFLMRNLRGRALFGSPRRVLRTIQSLVSTRVSRIGLMVEELDRQLFHGATLDRLPPWIVINATNLRTGKGWKFFADRAGDYLAGATEHTSEIRVAEAVAASAAYPGLTDSYAFTTRWEHLEGRLLSEDRWERPQQSRPGTVSRWRERFGKREGAVVFPLVDGGLYDNEGVNSLRGRRVSHAIISAVAPPESDSKNGFTPRRYLRIVEVIQDRLGAATRQLAHEMTHGIDPSLAGTIASTISEDLRRLAAEESMGEETRRQLNALAEKANALAAVGMPPRGHQFNASAQLLLHHTELADNAFAVPQRGGFDVPPRFRGLDALLVGELSRVRTDLDALEGIVVELLIAQGYFLADFYVKLTMPDLIFPAGSAAEWYTEQRAPNWDRAHKAVTTALANRDESLRALAAASRSIGLIGRVPSRRERWHYRSNLLLTPMICVLLGWTILRLILAIVHSPR